MRCGAAASRTVGAPWPSWPNSGEEHGRQIVDAPGLQRRPTLPLVNNQTYTKTAKETPHNKDPYCAVWGRRVLGGGGPVARTTETRDETLPTPSMLPGCSDDPLVNKQTCQKRSKTPQPDTAQ